jgi:3-oxoacyl-[acyl-carrier protein] reductase
MARVAVVTGGGTGLGKAIAAALIADGLEVVITGRRLEVLEKACAELGPAATPVSFDITDPESIEGALEALPGSIDVLVNNAGGSPDGFIPTNRLPGLAEIRRSWLANIELNLIGTVLVSEALKPRLANDARVIMLGSVAARLGGGAYGAAKAGLQSYTVQLAKELGRRGITVNVVAPGLIDEAADGDGLQFPPEMVKWFARNSAIGRAGRSADVTATVALLAAPANGAITGQVLYVDGGVVIGGQG